MTILDLNKLPSCVNTNAEKKLAKLKKFQQKRLEKNGPNSLPEQKKESVFSIFISEFKDPMILLLLIAIIASLIAGETIDAIAIIFIVLVDVIMGTYQENKANNTNNIFCDAKMLLFEELER